MVPFRTTAVIPLSPYLQIHSHHSLIPFIPSRFHCIHPSIHNNPLAVSAARKNTYKTPTLLLEILSYPNLTNEYSPNPIMHPSVLCITSSVSANPLCKKYCIASMVTETLQPIRSAINHEPLTLNSEPSIIPMGMNTMTFMMFSTSKSGRL